MSDHEHNWVQGSTPAFPPYDEYFCEACGETKPQTDYDTAGNRLPYLPEPTNPHTVSKARVEVNAFGIVCLLIAAGLICIYFLYILGL